jgi:hypothetical protein
MVAALIGNDYHFVGDTVAGGFLGWIGGLWIARLLGVKRQNESAVRGPMKSAEIANSASVPL